MWARSYSKLVISTFICRSTKLMMMHTTTVYFISLTDVSEDWNIFHIYKALNSRIICLVKRTAFKKIGDSSQDTICFRSSSASWHWTCSECCRPSSENRRRILTTRSTMHHLPLAGPPSSAWVHFLLKRKWKREIALCTAVEILCAHSDGVRESKTIQFCFLVGGKCPVWTLI